jgi:AIPR protein
MTKLSVNEFKNVIHEQLEQTASEYSLGSNYDQGIAFKYWIASLIVSAEQNYQGEPTDVTVSSKKLGVDVILEDEANRTLLLCECKYRTALKSIDEDDIRIFSQRHKSYMVPGWIKDNGSPEAIALLSDYPERVKDGWNIEFRFVSPGQITDDIRDLVRHQNEEYEKDGERVYCDIHDFGVLKDYYVRSLSLEASIPDEVVLDLPSGQFFEKADPLPTVIAVVKGNSLRNLYRQHKQSLYAWNIRGYLGNRGINQDISATAKSDPEHFFYFNNGVSAICTDFHFEGRNRLVATSLQIINGAQTVSTLGTQDPNPNVEVLFRLTRTQSVKTDKGVNQSVIRYNNSQNVVKVSDFRSNDRIHLFLEDNLKMPKSRGALPALYYVRKRTVGKKSRTAGIPIRLEDFAKVRYAFLYEPILIHASPKALWTPADDGGSYEQAFGVDGEIQDAWSKSTLNESFLALALYYRILRDARAMAAKNRELAVMQRLKFHALSLAGLYVRQYVASADYEAALRRAAEFEDLHKSFWPIARQSLINFFTSADSERMTLFALVRSVDRWQQLKRNFELQVAADTD